MESLDGLQLSNNTIEMALDALDDPESKLGLVEWAESRGGFEKGLTDLYSDLLVSLVKSRMQLHALNILSELSEKVSKQIPEPSDNSMHYSIFDFGLLSLFI